MAKAAADARAAIRAAQERQRTDGAEASGAAAPYRPHRASGTNSASPQDRRSYRRALMQT